MTAAHEQQQHQTILSGISGLHDSIPNIMSVEPVEHPALEMPAAQYEEISDEELKNLANQVDLEKPSEGWTIEGI